MRSLTLAIFAVSISATHASAAGTYGDRLIDGVTKAHRDVAAIEINATAKDGTPIHLLRGHLDAQFATRLPLVNSMGEPVGSVTLQFSSPKHIPAEQVARDLSRKIYVANNLIEADPFVAGAHRSVLAQGIVDKMMDSNPDLVTLGLHIGASGADNTILASNFGRIGKPGDKDDAKVIDQSATLKEVTNEGKRLAVSVPLLDRKGRTVGALSTSFLIGAGGPDAATARAIEVRDAMARQIPSLKALTK